MKATINYPPRVAYLADPMGCGLHSVVAVACEGMQALNLRTQAKALLETARVTSGGKLADKAVDCARDVLAAWSALQAAGVRDWVKIAADTYTLLEAIERRTSPEGAVVERLVSDTEPMLSADRDNREPEDEHAA